MEIFNNIKLDILLCMLKSLLFALFLVVCFTRTYPMYKQCDSKWGSQHLGTSTRTICQAGCLMSSAAMALSGLGHNYNPSTLNTWLIHNGGYVSEDAYVWAAIDKLGLSYKGRISNKDIKHNIDVGNVLMLNVHNGGHWVLAHGYNGDNILVNDPGFSTSQYSLSQIVNGKTGLYTVNKLPNFWNSLYLSAKQAFDSWIGSQQTLDYQKITTNYTDSDEQIIIG